MASQRMHLFRLLCILALIAVQAAPLVPALRAAPATLQQTAELAATLDDQLLIDSDGDAAVSAGDTLRYTLDISNTGSLAAADLSATIALDPNTTLVPGSLQISPLAFGDTFTTAVDRPLVIAAPGLLANDSGTPPPGALAATNLPTSAGGSVTLNADGSFRYTPPAGFSGNDSFSYMAVNPLGDDTASVTISVTTPADALADSVNVSNGATADFDLLANDTGEAPLVVQSYGPSLATVGANLPGQILTLGSGMLVTIAANGTLTVDARGLAAGSNGTDRLFYVLASGDGNSDTAEITISYGDLPLAAADTFAATRDTPLSIPAGSGLLANDALGNPVASLTFFGGGDASAAISTPAGATLNFADGSLSVNADGSFTFTPASGFRGIFQFTYRIANTLGSSDALVEIAVQAAPNASADGPYLMLAGETLTISAADPNDLLDNDDRGFPAAVLSSFGGGSLGGSVADNLAGSSIALAGGILSVNADGSFSLAAPRTQGSYSFDYQIANGSGAAEAGVTIIVEAPPALRSSLPADNDFITDLAADLSITFSEPVNVSGNWFELACSSSGTRSIADTTVTGGPTTYTINPSSDFAPDDSCTVTIFAAQVRDQDSNDPPDNPLADEQFTFTIEQAPQVTATTPANGAGGVATGADLTVTFSEPVDLTTASFELQCPNGTPQSFALSVAGTVATINPDVNLPADTACTLTVIAAGVSDSDPIDPPDTLVSDVSVSFSTIVDMPPTVISTTPANGATAVAVESALTITFSEPVDVTAGAFSLECPAGNPRAFTIAPALPASAADTFTLSPSAPLPADTTCTAQVSAANVRDSDLDEPPDAMPADYLFSFQTLVDAAPEVSNTTPANGAATIATTTDIGISFSEPVDVSGNWFAIVCSTSGTRSVADSTVSGGPTIFTINPTSDFAQGEVCTVTIFAAQVRDQDVAEPPDTMAANALFSFTIDTAPSVSSTTPADNETNIALNTNIDISFSEPVDVSGNWFTIVCSTSGTRNVAATSVSGGPTTFTINPDTDFVQGETCSVTLAAALITDVDSGDPPNDLTTNYSFGFTIDVAPQVSSTLPADNAMNVVPSANLSITFSEAVDVTSSSFSLSCGAGALTFALSGSGSSTISLDPDSDLPSGASCTLTVNALEVRDSDAGDPPDQLDGNGDGVTGDSVSVSFQTQVLANDDAYTITPHLTYLSPSGVRTNDSPSNITISGFGPTLATANDTVPNGSNTITADGAGGRVLLNADGTFSFYPDAGDTNLSGTASFFYTISGGDTAQVTLNFEAEELLWFVDNTPAGTAVCTESNLGTQACPAGDIATVAAVDSANDIIFVASGTYTGGVTLEAGMWLLGDGSSGTLAGLVAARVTPVSGSDFAPYTSFSGSDPLFSSSFSDAITLATSNTIRGITIGNTGNFAGIVGTNYGTLTISESTISGDGQILNLDSGTVNASFDSLASNSSDNSFAALRVANSVVTFASSSGVSISGSAAGVEAILLTSNSGSGFNLGNTSINKTTSGNGVVLGSGLVQSAPVSFTQLSITTSAGSALLTNRQTGTVSVINTLGSNLSASGGAAINVINSAGNITPLSLSLGNLSATNSSIALPCLAASGSPAGLCLAGASGILVADSLTVISGVNRYGVRVVNSSALIALNSVNISGMSGSSVETDFDANGYPDTDGDGDGIFLSSNTGSFIVNAGSVQNTTSAGADNVDVRNSRNVNFSNVTLSNSYKHNFQAINLSGSGSFNNSNVANAGSGFSGAAVGFNLRSNTGTLTIFDIDNSNCTMPAVEGDCIRYIGEGSHTGTLDIDGDGSGLFGNFRTNSNAADVQARGAATITFSMDEMQVSPNGTGLGGMNLAAFENATLNFRLINNLFTNSANGLPPVFDGVIRGFAQGTGATLRGRIDGNTVDTAPGASRRAIQVITVDTLSAFELLIANNSLEISGGQPAILFRTEGATLNGPALRSGDIFIENNFITSQTSDINGRGIDMLIGDQAGEDIIRTLIRGNVINTTGAGSTANALRIRMEANADQTHATVLNNSLNSGAGSEFIAATNDTRNQFCLDLRGHSSGDFNLSETAGTFTVENFNSLNADNPGALINVGAGITSGGACAMPTDSGLVAISEPEPQPAQNTSVTASIGTLPAGKQVRVVFDVQVADPLADTVRELGAQATISSSNAATLLSDDPATAAAADATRTKLGRDQAGSTIYLPLIMRNNDNLVLPRRANR